MAQSLNRILSNTQIFESFVPKLRTIFDDMDSQYRSVAGQYGFHCQGCEENCCLTEFYHHTLLEFLYLQKGYGMLDSDIRLKIAQKAHSVYDHYKNQSDTRAAIRVMCPLNIDNFCVLYEYRPMICRLHGIPYELHQPNRSVRRGPGCHIFDQQCAAASYVTFDRTSFYGAMAALENDLRAAFLFVQKLKMSVAEMIITFTYGREE